MDYDPTVTGNLPSGLLLEELQIQEKALPLFELLEELRKYKKWEPHRTRYIPFKDGGGVLSRPPYPSYYFETFEEAYETMWLELSNLYENGERNV